MRTSSSTARMVRGATCRHVGAAPSAVGWAEEGGGGSGGMFAGAAPSGLGSGDDAQPQDGQQQQRRRQQAAAFDPDVVVPAPPPPHHHHHHQDTDATQAVGSDLPVEPTAELDAMVLDRVSKMVLGDDNAGGCVGSSEAPSPSTTSTSTSTALVVEDPLPPVGGGEDGTWSDETAAATGTAETMTAATAATARPPARRFRVRSASVTATATGDTCTADGCEQRRAVNRNNKRDATDLTATPVTNNQTTRPTGRTGTAPGDPTPSPVRDVGVHPLLLVGTAGSTSISSSTTSSSSSSAGLLPRLSPPLGLRSPTSTCTTAGGILIPPRACLAPSNSPTSTAATPTVTVETICCTTTSTTSNATTTATTNATPCPHHQLSKDGTSLTIDGGATGGRKRRMLKKRHRRSNASFLAGAGCRVISINMSLNPNVASSSSWGGDVAIPSNEGGGPAAVEDGGCLGGILPDLADILDGACGGGTEDVIDGIGGMATVRGSPCHANGIGGGGGCPHHPLAAGCGEGSSFPLPFGLVARAARRSGSTSSRPSSTTLSSGGISQGSSRPERSNHSPEPHPLARPKRPSAPTPPGASVMSQISCNVFDQRLDRLASGVQMPTARGTAAGSSGGNGLPPPPNLVPKFRASPLPFSANLRLTPQPRRAAASRKGISSRRVRTGAKSGGNLGATLSVSTGFGNSAAFSPHHPPLEGPSRYRQIGGSGGFPIPPADSIGTMLRDHDKTCANRCMSNSL